MNKTADNRILQELFIIENLTKRMKHIEERLDGITENKGLSNIKSLAESSSEQTSSSTTNPAAWDDLKEVMVGFDDYETELKEELIAYDTDPLKIISIIGKSGSGKTKLARKIFNSEDVRKHFKIRSWNTLPPNYRATDVLTKIHRQVETQVPNKNKVQSYDKNNGVDKLKDELDEGRYLVVLDGIASITHVNSIKAALPDLRNGSRVLIILQPDPEVFENFAGPSIHKIKINPLDKEGNKKLFLHMVLRKDEPKSRFDKIGYATTMFDLTQGVPLATVILAGLLRSNESKTKWDSIIGKLRNVNRENVLDRILAESFIDLSHSLKSCLLYFSALQENKSLNAHKLVRLWISERFIELENGRTLEEIGQQHLKELISRCLVELVKKDAQGDVASVAIHGKVHNFVRSEARRVNFLQIHDNAGVNAPSNVRRLSVQNHTDKYVPLRNYFPKLRSFICDFDEEENTNETRAPTNQKQTLTFLYASKYLRVIDLQGLLLERIPSVGSMIHLRYLGIKNCSLVCTSSKMNWRLENIGNLIYLETLDVQDPVEITDGERFWNIPTLRHIFACKIKPSKCMKAKDNLQTLHGLDCANWDNIALLENASNLRSLEIEGLKNSHWKALVAALKKLELLVHLKLKCSEGASVPWDIFDISVLHRLQSLEIDGRIEKSQTQESTPKNAALPNLTKLILRNTKMCKDFIFRLANFPRLSYLKLEDSSSYPEKNIIINFPENSFDSLTELHVNLGKLEEWRIEKSAMPKLAKLCFSSCSEMVTIPDSLKDLHGLKEVLVHNCPKIGPSIDDKQGQEYEKIKHVPIIHVR